MMRQVNTMIHVNDLIQAQRCPKLCWNHKYISMPYFSFYHMDIPFSMLWKQYLHIEDRPSGQTNDTNEMTLARLKETDVLLHARFEYQGCRIKIPVLKKIEEGYLAIYPHLSAYPKESEATLMKINQMIAAKNGISITQQKILYINKDYVRKDTLDLDALFCESDKLFNRRNKLHHTIAECMDACQFDLDEWIKKTQELLDVTKPPKYERTKQCTAGRRCIFYSHCFDESDLPDDSVLFLTTSQYKLDAYKDNIVHIKDMPLDQMEGYRLQYAQVMASRNGYFMDRIAMEHWLKQIQYPISYLDFEWDTFAIPPYKNMKPFDVLCFQYSLHVEDKEGKLIHKDFFGAKDCRQAFIESLIASIPPTGSILVYNMEGAEKLRLKQLSEQFPVYAEKLDQICSRMIDLSKPFELGIFYDNRMRGHYSLKNVLPVFTKEYSYTKLDIQNGLHAVQAYRHFDQEDAEEQEQIRENIRTYCSMDTFAEFIVYHGLIHLVKEE